MSLIETRNLTYIYDKKDPNGFDALHNINIQIEKGDFVAIVGKTGSGKSTLVQTFNALLLPTSGETRVENFIITGDKKRLKKELKELPIEVQKDNKKLSKLRKKVGMVFQFPEYQLFAENVLKDVMFGPKNFGLSEEEAKKKSIEALKSVGLNEKYFQKSPFELSGGEKRRVAIAGILASEPEVLILDEPTAGLDPIGKREIMELIKKYHESGDKTIIVVTHDMDIVLNYAKKVIVLSDSKLIETLTPSELFNTHDLTNYSLEIPTIYKFKNLLKSKGFAGFLDDKNDFNSIIDEITRVKKWAMYLDN